MPEGGTHAMASLPAVEPARADGGPSRSGDRDVRNAWRSALLAFGVVVAALCLAFADTVADLGHAWSSSGTFAHGWLILPTSLWLVWRLRAELATVLPRAQPLAILPLVAAGGVWLVAHTAGVHAPAAYAFVAMGVAAVWGVFGNAVTRRILFPLAFLFLMVPAGDFLMPTLIDHTADFTVWALRASGIPVYREANFFSIPSGNWSVVEACSGLRYLIASITLGCLFAYLNYRGAWRRAAFIVASIAVPIVANWLRAYLIVMIAHTSSNALATGVDHLVYGWLFFGLVMLLLFWVGSFWRDDDEETVARAGVDDRAAAGEPGTARGRSFAAVASALVAFALPWPAAATWLGHIADATHPATLRLADVPGWSAVDGRASAFVPHYQNPRVVFDRDYAADGRRVNLFVGYYSGQATHGALVTYGNAVVYVGDKAWGEAAQRDGTLTAGGRPLPVVESEVRGQLVNERLLAARWYWVDGRTTTSDYVAKAWTALDKLAGRGDDSAVVVVTAPVGPQGSDAARESIAAFVASAGPAIAEALAALREEARR